MNVFSVSKTVDAPLPFVYAWCTDFAAVQEKVPAATRRVVQSNRDRVVYIELYSGRGGQQRVGVDIITLDPPTSWRMEYLGEDNDEIGEYRLKAMGKGRTRIRMRFRNRWKGDLSLSTEEKRRIESETWDKYIAVLEKDFSLGRMPRDPR